MIRLEKWSKPKVKLYSTHSKVKSSNCHYKKFLVQIRVSTFLSFISVTFVMRKMLFSLICISLCNLTINFIIFACCCNHVFSQRCGVFLTKLSGGCSIFLVGGLVGKILKLIIFSIIQAKLPVLCDTVVCFINLSGLSKNAPF